MSRSLFRVLLLAGFIDEFAGVGSVGAADIQHDLGFSYATTALALFTIPEILAMIAEPLLMMLAHVHGPRRAMIAGLLTMGLGLVGCAFATGWWSLALLTTVYFIGSGLGTNLAKTTLLDAFPDKRPWIMARWTLLGALGDIGTPVFLAFLAWLALGWRTAFVAVGLVVLVQGLAVWGSPVEGAEEEDEDDDERSAWAVLREALGNRPMLAWLLASATCGLLDEVFVAFGGLYLVSAFATETATRSLVLGGYMVGGVLGVVVLERLLERGTSPRRVVVLSSLATAGCFLAWMFAPTLALNAVALGAVGFFAAQLWPLTEAEAYASTNASSRIVEVASSVFTPVSLGLPLLLGLMADAYGLEVALWLLLLQPLVVFFIGTLAERQAKHP